VRNSGGSFTYPYSIPVRDFSFIYRYVRPLQGYTTRLGLFQIVLSDLRSFCFSFQLIEVRKLDAVPRKSRLPCRETTQFPEISCLDVSLEERSPEGSILLFEWNSVESQE
jgi:hypothetical protein